jgi:hypothetical protein
VLLKEYPLTRALNVLGAEKRGENVREPAMHVTGGAQMPPQPTTLSDYYRALGVFIQEFFRNGEAGFACCMHVCRIKPKLGGLLFQSVEFVDMLRLLPSSRLCGDWRRRGGALFARAKAAP